MTENKSKEERIYDWALQVSAVEMVKELSKSFKGLVLSNERDTQAVITIVNSIIGRLTQIGDLADTGLGIPYWDLRDGSKKEQTNKKGQKK